MLTLLRSLLLLPLLLLFVALPVLTASTATAATGSKAPVTDLTVIARQLERTAAHQEHALPPNKVLNVCAVPQLYLALQALSTKSRYPFVPRVATATEIYALIANTDNSKLPLLCDAKGLSQLLSTVCPRAAGAVVS